VGEREAGIGALAGSAPSGAVQARRRDRIATKTRILDAAERLFARSGFEAVTTKQVTIAAGVATGALYHHFANKEELYVEVVKRAIAARADLPEELIEPTDEPEARLVEVVTWFVRTILADDNFRLLIGREMLDPSPGGPELLDPIVFHESLSLTRSLIARVAPAADADRAIASLLALIYGFSSMRGIYEIYPSIKTSLATPEQISAHSTSLLLDGLRGP